MRGTFEAADSVLEVADCVVLTTLTVAEGMAAEMVIASPRIA